MLVGIAGLLGKAGCCVFLGFLCGWGYGILMIVFGEFGSGFVVVLVAGSVLIVC